MDKKCIMCNGIDSKGLISGLCIDCYDLSLDIGKGLTKKQKNDLENRRFKNGYWSNVDNDEEDVDYNIKENPCGIWGFTDGVE